MFIIRFFHFSSIQKDVGAKTERTIERLRKRAKEIERNESFREIREASGK
jgi:hypothetical protein